MADLAALPRMTAEAFVAWAMEQPEGKRHELVAGEVVAMAPERSAHALAKLHIARRLLEAVEAADVPCTVYPDGMAVTVDAATVYEPDALVRCGAPLPAAATLLTDPVIVVEMLSPSSRSRDPGRKLIDYFRIPSVAHYMIVDPEIPALIHHRRADAGAILTRIVRDGPLALDPPGIVLEDPFLPAAR